MAGHGADPRRADGAGVRVPGRLTPRESSSPTSSPSTGTADPGRSNDSINSTIATITYNHPTAEKPQDTGRWRTRNRAGQRPSRFPRGVQAQWWLVAERCDAGGRWMRMRRRGRRRRMGRRRSSPDGCEGRTPVSVRVETAGARRDAGMRRCGRPRVWMAWPGSVAAGRSWNFSSRANGNCPRSRGLWPKGGAMAGVVVGGERQCSDGNRRRNGPAERRGNKVQAAGCGGCRCDSVSPGLT